MKNRFFKLFIKYNLLNNLLSKNIIKKIESKNKIDLDNPVFSVIIPIYDRTSELREAIDSVLNQTFLNFEIILICDGSPIDTVKIVDEYLKEPRIKSFKYSDNSGNACRGRNKGISIAKGKYIVFLDSDDICYKDRLFKTYYYFFKEEVDVVSGSVEFIVDGSRDIDGIKNGQIAKSTPFNFEVLKKMNLLYTCTVAVSKKCLDQYGYFRGEMKYREDHELWLRLAYNGCKIYNVQDVFSKYRVHSGNAELKFLHEDDHWYKMMLKLYSKNYNWKEII